MEILLYILLFLILLLLLILILPISIEIDTTENKYKINVFRIISANIIVDFNSDEIVILHISSPVYKYNFKPVNKIINSNMSDDKKEEKQKKKKEKKNRKKFNLKFENIKRLIISIYKSFNVKYFRLNVDTGDMITNGILQPYFSMISGKNISLNINYYSEFHLKTHISNRLINIVKPAIIFFIKTKGVSK